MKKIVQLLMILVVLLVAFDEVHACECEFKDGGCKIKTAAAQGNACKCVSREITKAEWPGGHECCAPKSGCRGAYECPNPRFYPSWECDAVEIPCSQSRNPDDGCRHGGQGQRSGITGTDCWLGGGCCSGGAKVVQRS